MRINAFSLTERDYVLGEIRWLGQDLNISIEEECIDEFLINLSGLLSGKKNLIKLDCNPIDKICSVDDENETRKFISYRRLIISLEEKFNKTNINLSDFEAKVTILRKDLRILEKLCRKKHKRGFREYEEFIVCIDANNREVFINFWPWNAQGVITYAN